MSYGGNCRLGDLFTSRREKGRPGLPTFSITLNDGLVNREDLDRKQETSLSPEEHLLVRPGDIAYNMMRMWQGAFGLASKEGLVSPAYVVLKAKPAIDPLYASFLLKSKRLRYLLWAYSYGLTNDRLRLYFQDFAKIPVTVPPKRIQEEAAKVLATWDQAISAAERLRDVTAKRNASITRDLVLGKKRLAGMKGEWRSCRLRDIASVIVSSVDKKTADAEVPIVLCNYTHVYYRRQLLASMSFDVGTATQTEIDRFRLLKGDVVVTKDSEEPNDIGIASYVLDEIPNLVCGYHLAIVRPNADQVDGAFLSCLFEQHDVRRHLAVQANGVTRFGLPVKAIEDVPLLLPSVEGQRKISELVFHLHDEHLNLVRYVTKLAFERTAIANRLLVSKGSAS